MQVIGWATDLHALLTVFCTTMTGRALEEAAIAGAVDFGTVPGTRGPLPAGCSCHGAFGEGKDKQDSVNSIVEHAQVVRCSRGGTGGELG